MVSKKKFIEKIKQFAYLKKIREKQAKEIFSFFTDYKILKSIKDKEKDKLDVQLES